MNNKATIFLVLILLVCHGAACPASDENAAQETSKNTSFSQSSADPSNSQYDENLGTNIPDETENNRADLYGSFSNTLPDTIADAVLIDGLIYSSFYLAGLVKKPIAIPLAIAGSIVGYSFRKTCNKYFLSDISEKENLSYYEYAKKAGCGLIGGALKYGIKGTTALPETLIRGAVNNAFYEISSQNLENYYKENNHLGFDGTIIGIEILDGTMEAVLEAKAGDEVDTIKTGVLGGLLVVTYAQTFASYFSNPFKEWLSWFGHTQLTAKLMHDEL